jgi:hypothetical protein
MKYQAARTDKLQPGAPTLETSMQRRENKVTVKVWLIPSSFVWHDPCSIREPRFYRRFATAGRTLKLRSGMAALILLCPCDDVSSSPTRTSSVEAAVVVSSGAVTSVDLAKLVMPGLVPGIHVLLEQQQKTWMAGTSPAMTKSVDGRDIGERMRRRP